LVHWEVQFALTVVADLRVFGRRHVGLQVFGHHRRHDRRR
jgi:hypothetical protein